MAKSKTPNERIKHEYIDFLRQAMGRSEASLEAVAAALRRFESYTRFRDFHDFRIEQAKAFKSRLAKESNAWTGEKLKAGFHRDGGLKSFRPRLRQGAISIRRAERLGFGPLAAVRHCRLSRRWKPRMRDVRRLAELSGGSRFPTTQAAARGAWSTTRRVTTI
jgi:hypothetical protein